MHFWIDKRSQGCGFNVRRQVPPSLSGYGRNQRNLCGSLYPKPMVTPVHRFQSIESVANNGLRYNRAPSYHARAHSQPPPNVHYNGSSGNIRMPQMGRSLEMIAPGHTPTARNNNHPTPKIKCGVWVFFLVSIFFAAGLYYYLSGVNSGVEVLLFCSLLVMVVMVGGVVCLWNVIKSYAPSHSPLEPAGTAAPEQHENDETNQVPTSAMPQNSSELPPPPYHIAVMLSPTTDLDVIQVIRDSPPPSYEKAVT